MNCSPSPGSAITRSHWRGMGTRPSVTPSAPRFFAFSSLVGFSPSFAFGAFFFAPRSSLRRSTTYSAPFSRWGNGWRELMICGDRNGITFLCT